MFEGLKILVCRGAAQTGTCGARIHNSPVVDAISDAGQGLVDGCILILKDHDQPDVPGQLGSLSLALGTIPCCVTLCSLEETQVMSISTFCRDRWGRLITAMRKQQTVPGLVCFPESRPAQGFPDTCCSKKVTCTAEGEGIAGCILALAACRAAAISA